MTTVLQSEWPTNGASYGLSYQASGPMHLSFAFLAVSMQDQACSIRVLPEMKISLKHQIQLLEHLSQMNIERGKSLSNDSHVLQNATA